MRRVPSLICTTIRPVAITHPVGWGGNSRGPVTVDDDAGEPKAAPPVGASALGS